MKIYKASLRLGHIPLAWQSIKVTFIPKPGKTDYTSAKSFRLISLASFFLKGLERLIDRYLKEKMDETQYLHASQHAFQQGRSTDTALHELITNVEKTISDKEYMISTFMDIEGAFDNVTFDAKNNNIAECGANHRVRLWIKSMLEFRNINYFHNGRMVTVRATRGNPQGGVLSPLLWLIVMNSLIKRLHEHGFKTLGYADDLCVSCRGKFLSALSDRTQAAIKMVEVWCQEMGRRVNPTKSEIIIFTKKQEPTGTQKSTPFR